jgi:hypothetical protein
MLACSVAIPVLAIWGASWSEVVKKFQNFHCPAILNLASASPSTPAPTGDAPPLAAGKLPLDSSSTPIVAPALPAGLARTNGGKGDSPVFAETKTGTVPAAAVPSDYHQIQERLQKLGATYYVLESWGNDQQLYRFFCKMAVTGNANYVHCFEATHADPLRAMQQVLQQVETWRGGVPCGG